MDLKGKSILVTGSSRGIGQATAILVAKQGANVAINYQNSKSKAEQTAKQIEKLGVKVIVVQGDVSLPQEAKKIIATTYKELGSLDVLVNNAAIVSWENFEVENLQMLHQIVDVNLNGVINMTYETIPLMRKQKQGGVIVNISSDAGKTGYAGLAVYCATKFAVLGLTESLGKEFKNQIRVYAVCPGAVATDMTGNQGMPPEKVAKRIIETASESLRLKNGGNTEIYS